MFVKALVAGCLAFFLSFAGCLGDERSAYAFGCPKSSPVPSEFSSESRAAYWLVVQNCRFTGDGPRILNRPPGSDSLWVLANGLAKDAEELGIETTIFTITRAEILPEGTSTFDDVDAEFVEHLRLPVLVFSLEGNPSLPTILLQTSFETLTHTAYGSPHDKPVTAGLSSSGLAAALTALEILHRSDAPHGNVWLVAGSGDLGHENWLSLSSIPFFEETPQGKSLADQAQFGLVVQDVGACSMRVHNESRGDERPASAMVYEQIRQEWRDNGIRWVNESLVTKFQPPFSYFGVADYLATFHGIPTAYIGGGWPAPHDSIGTIDDTLAAVCPQTVAETAEFLARAILRLSRQEPPTMMPCERQWPWDCS